MKLPELVWNTFPARGGLLVSILIFQRACHGRTCNEFVHVRVPLCVLCFWGVVSLCLLEARSAIGKENRTASEFTFFLNMLNPLPEGLSQYHNRCDMFV